jgi:SAM-dependent methyltransferase
VSYNPNQFSNKNPGLGVYPKPLEIPKGPPLSVPPLAGPPLSGPPLAGSPDPGRGSDNQSTHNASRLLNNNPGLMVFRQEKPAAPKEPVPPPVYDPGLYKDSFNRLGLLHIENVCDLGCGTGNFTGVMVKMRQRTEVYVGVDNSHAQISVAKAAYPGWNFIYGDFMNPQIREKYERFDAFLLLNVLDVIEDDLAALEILPSDKPVVFSMPRTPKADSIRYFDDQMALKQRYGNILNIRSVGRYRNSEAVYSMVVGVRW